jgi:phosphatidate cytidylyltransferase
LAGSPQGTAEGSDRRSRARTLMVRVLAGVVLVPVVLSLNYLGGLAFAVFLGLVTGLGTLEFFRLGPGAGIHPSRLVGVAGSIAVCLSFYWGSLGVSGLVLTLVVLAVLMERLIRQDVGGYARAVGMTVLGLVYVGWFMGFFILLRGAVGLSAPLDRTGGPGAGHWYVLFVLLVTWSYDTLAYVGGLSVGRHRLFTRISPAKTAEGTASGLAAAAAAALICKGVFAVFMGWAEALLVGLALGVAAQAGDLVESIVKRSTGAKDSSHLIPGHGGILDRFDSLLFTGPLFYMYLRAISAWTGS